MANKKTMALTQAQFEQIIALIKTGFTTSAGKQVKPNIRIATALTLQANLGLRIGDIIALRLRDIIADGGRMRLNIVEEKTRKTREFTVPSEIYTYLQTYALNQGIRPTQRLFDLTTRAIQHHLQLATEHLGLSGLGTHSFRKYFAVSIYNENGYNVELVRQL